MAQAGSLTEMDTKQSVRDALLVKTRSRTQNSKALQVATLEQYAQLENSYFGGDKYGYKPNAENDSQ